MDATRAIIQSQYHAAIDMLQQAVEACPEPLWDSRDDKNPFWHITYHALFYTHLYLQPTEADFIPWGEDRVRSVSLRRMDQAGDDTEPFSQSEILTYLAHCRDEVDRQIAALDLAGESGFDWLLFNKLELQMYNIRHIQQHTGELCERLWAKAGIEVRWVGMKAG